MRLQWIGQGGFFVQSHSNHVVMLDPYLSNQMEKERGVKMKRQSYIDETLLDMQIDVLILTHMHPDHTDFATLDQLIPQQKKSIAILAPLHIWSELRERYSDKHNYILFERGIEVTIHDMLFKAVLAVHNDERSIGVVIENDGKSFYLVGDSLYHKDLPNWIEGHIDVMAVPINGLGNNMNTADAVRLAKKILPSSCIPIHWDMFKAYGCDPAPFVETLNTETNIHSYIPKIYREIRI